MVDVAITATFSLLITAGMGFHMGEKYGIRPGLVYTAVLGTICAALCFITILYERGE